MPKTKLGKWSVWLIVAFIIFLSIFYLMIASGQRGGEFFFSNLWLTIPILIAAICGISSFFTGIISVIKDSERSVFVYLSSLLGFLVLLFVLGEFISPH
ncbi:MAG: hypothetical protein ABH837_01510 [bacterium]